MPRGGARPGAGRPPGKTKGHETTLPGPKAGPGRPPKSERRKSVEDILYDEIGREIEAIEKVGLTESLIRKIALEGLGTLRYYARRGNLRAAIFLVNQCVGQPAQPFAQRVQDMGPDEVRGAFLALLNQVQLPDVVVQLVTERLTESNAHTSPTVAPIIPSPGAALAGEDLADVSAWANGEELEAPEPHLRDRQAEPALDVQEDAAEMDPDALYERLQPGEDDEDEDE